MTLRRSGFVSPLCFRVCKSVVGATLAVLLATVRGRSWLLLAGAGGLVVACAERARGGWTPSRSDGAGNSPVAFTPDAEGANEESSAETQSTRLVDAGLEVPVGEAGLVGGTHATRTHSTETRDDLDDSGVEASVHVISIEVCPPGTFAQGGDALVRRCEPCPKETYSSGVNWSQCDPWSECGWAPVVAQGTSESDRACAPRGRIVQFGSREMDAVSDLVVGAEGGVYVAGTAEGDFPGFARLSGAGTRYIAKVGQGGRLEWVTYLQESLGRSLLSESGDTELVSMGQNLVAVWRDADFDGYRHDLVLTEVSAQGKRVSETRVALEVDQQNPFPPTFNIGAAVRAADDDIVVAATRRESTWDECGSSMVFRMRLNGGVVWSDALTLSDVCVSWEAAAVHDGVAYLGGNVHTGRSQQGLVHAVSPDGVVLTSWDFEQTAGRLESLVVDQDSSLIIALSNGVDAQLQKWASPGTQVWSKTLRGAYRTPRLALGDAGSVWVTGGTDLIRTSRGYDGLGAHYGSVDVYVEKIAASGETMWLTQFGSAGDEAGIEVCVVADQVYVAGETDATLGVSMGNVDGFVAQLNDVMVGL